MQKTCEEGRHRQEFSLEERKVTETADENMELKTMRGKEGGGR